MIPPLSIFIASPFFNTNSIQFYRIYYTILYSVLQFEHTFNASKNAVLYQNIFSDKTILCTSDETATYSRSAITINRPRFPLPYLNPTVYSATPSLDSHTCPSALLQDADAALLNCLCFPHYQYTVLLLPSALL